MKENIGTDRQTDKNTQERNKIDANKMVKLISQKGNMCKCVKFCERKYVYMWK